MDYNQFCVLLMKVECDDMLLEMWKFLYSILGPNRDGKAPLKNTSNMFLYPYHGSDNLVNRYQDFLSIMEIRIESNSLWKSILEDSVNEIEISHIHDYFEIYVMDRIYQQAYHATANQAEDELLLQRIKLLSFITPHHLQLEILSDRHNIDALFTNAIQEFNQIITANTPRLKLACVQKSINTILHDLNKMQHNGNNDSDNHTNVQYGADEVLPLFILIMVKSCNPYIVSNFKFMEAYLNPDQVKYELGYILTTYESAMTYIQSIDESSFTGMNAKEFRRRFSITLVDRQYIAPAISKARDNNNTSYDSNRRIIMPVMRQDRNPYDLVVAYDEYAMAEDHKGMDYIHSLWSLVAVSQLTPAVARALRYILAPLPVSATSTPLVLSSKTSSTTSSTNNHDDVVASYQKKLARLMEFFTNEKIPGDAMKMNCPVLRLECFGSVLCVLVAEDYPKYAEYSKLFLSTRSLDQISKDLQDLYTYRLTGHIHASISWVPSSHHDSSDKLSSSMSSSSRSEIACALLQQPEDGGVVQITEDMSAAYVENKDRSATVASITLLDSIQEQSGVDLSICQASSPYDYPVLFLRESQGGKKTRCFEVYQSYPIISSSATPPSISRNSCLSDDCYLLERAAVSLMTKDSYHDTGFQSVIRNKSCILSRSLSSPLLSHPEFFHLLISLLHDAYCYQLSSSSYPLPLTHKYYPEMKRCHDDPLLLLRSDADEIRGLFILAIVYQLYQSLHRIADDVDVVDGDERPSNTKIRYIYSIDLKHVDMRELGKVGLIMSGTIHVDEFPDRREFSILAKIDESLFEACSMIGMQANVSTLWSWYQNVWQCRLMKELVDMYIAMNQVV